MLTVSWRSGRRQRSWNPDVCVRDVGLYHVGNGYAEEVECKSGGRKLFYQSFIEPLGSEVQFQVNVKHKLKY